MQGIFLWFLFTIVTHMLLICVGQVKALGRLYKQFGNPGFKSKLLYLFIYLSFILNLLTDHVHLICR